MLVEDSILIEKHEEHEHHQRLEGNIYCGKVQNVLQGMQSAFVDIGDKRNTFIRLKDLLPKDLIKDNLYYSSMIVSNLGAIKCGAIYHNLTNFGTCSSLATMGEIRKEEIINNKDKKEIRSICEFGVNFDERVADGYYFVKCIQLLQYIFDNPELLEEDACKKIEIKEIR